MNYNDEHGYPLHFQFENRRHALLGSNPMNATWLFMVLTNNGSGAFVPALLAEPANFRTPDDGGYYEFWMRDTRLLDFEWKLRVTRTFGYRLPWPVSSIWARVRTPADVWESDIMHPSISNWTWESGAESARSFRFPERPTATNSPPAFLTNGGSLFGGEERYRVR